MKKITSWLQKTVSKDTATGAPEPSTSAVNTTVEMASVAGSVLNLDASMDEDTPGTSTSAQSHQYHPLQRDADSSEEEEEEEAGDRDGSGAEESEAGSEEEEEVGPAGPKSDISFFAEKRPLTRDLRNDLLRTDFTVPPSYKFPESSYEAKDKDGATITKTRSFKREWLQSRGWDKWIVYSPRKDGAYCKFCVAFASTTGVGKGKSTTAKSFVSEPYNRRSWKDAVQHIREHHNSSYHKQAVADAANFLRFEDQHNSVVDQLTKKDLELKAQRRQNLEKMARLLYTMAQQDVPTRGHREDATTVDDLHSPTNPGNFLSFIGYLRHVDPDFKKTMDGCPKTAKYTHHDIQDELISIMGDMIKESVVHNVLTSGHGIYSILCDETSDVSRTEQLVIVVRYIDSKAPKGYGLREQFLTFIPLVGLTGEEIADKILRELEAVGLGPDKATCVGLGMDGASNMSGEHKGAAARIQKVHKYAIYFHCCSHRLNLAVNSAATNLDTAIARIKSTVSFFGFPQRQQVLQEILTKLGLANEHRKKALLAFTDTRFSSKHDAVTRFAENIQVIIAALEEIAESKMSADARSGAVDKLNSLRRFDFIFEIFTLASVAPQLFKISSALQGTNVDLLLAHQLVKDLISDLNSILNDKSETSEFRKAWDKAVAISATFYSKPEACIPRGKNKQNLNPRMYYRERIWDAYLKGLMDELGRRFGQPQKAIFSLRALIPATLGDAGSLGDVVAVLDSYYDVHQMEHADVKSEVTIWARRWLNSLEDNPSPHSSLSTLAVCDANFFPAVSFGLRLLATCPATSCEAERSFSALKRIKTNLRNKLGEDRLTSQACISGNRDIPIDFKEVVRRFERRKDRRF